MKYLKTAAVFSLVFLLATTLQSAAPKPEIKFAKMPTVKAAGGVQTISFELATPCDVEVAILDATGRVIRHLAAGVLGGENVPPAPLQPGLVQVLQWDGLDDFGKKGINGTFKFRIRAGINPKLGGFIGDDPYTFGAFTDIQSDEDGNIYIIGDMGATNQRSRSLRVFDADGRYRRELMPFPATVPPGGMKDVAIWDEEYECWRPRNLSCLNPEFYAGSLTFIGASKEHGLLFTDLVKFYELNSDGSVKGATFKTRDLAQIWPKEFHHWGGLAEDGRRNLAVSPDHKWLYVSGVYYSRDQHKERLPHGRIFRMGLDQPASLMEPFVTINPTEGDWKKGGVDDGQKAAPTHGIDIDLQGRVYVCDRVHDCIAVFDESGKALYTIPVSSPDLVKVQPDAKFMYVVRRLRTGYYQYDGELLKFDTLEQGSTPIARNKLPSSLKYAMAVAGKADSPRVWIVAQGVANPLEFIDEGTTLRFIEDGGFKPHEGAQQDWIRMAVDYDRNEIYVSDGCTKIWRYDGQSGEGGLLKVGGTPFIGAEVAVGYDGYLVVRTGSGFSGPLERFTRDLAPAPFPSGSHQLSPYIYGRMGIGYSEKGVGCGPNGEIYAAFMYDWTLYGLGGFTPEGRGMQGKYLKEKFPAVKPAERAKYPADLQGAVVGPIPAFTGGVKVDLQGNIYIGMAVRKSGWQPLPSLSRDAIYKRWTGSVLKFDPKVGGAILGLKDSESLQPDIPRIDLEQKMIAEGALCSYEGISPYSGGGPGGNTSGCVCRVPRFDVDRFGRVALPGALAANTVLHDNNGNLIAMIGAYGNFDSQYVVEGRKSPDITVPAIPVAWPTSVGFSCDNLYICDGANRRIVRVKMEWQLEQEVAIK